MINERMKLTAPQSEQDAMEELDATLKQGAIRNQGRFKSPDDDWRPYWLVLERNGCATLITGRLRSNLEKRALTKTVAGYARKVGAVGIGHLHSTWAITAEDTDERRFKEIERQMKDADGDSEGVPERKEQLLLDLHTATLWRMYLAPIQRHEKSPPTLGEFRLYAEGGSHRAEGPMITPLIEALVRLG